MATIKGCFYLPEEIMIKILARSSVKSLLRFKSVCKSWNGLIKNNPTFIAKHLNRAASNDDNTRIAIKYRQLYSNQIYSFTKAFFSFLSNEAVQISRCLVPSQFFDKNADENDIILCGSCNGIICAVGFLDTFIKKRNDHIILWNPATREIKHIFVPNLHHRDDNARACFKTAGFGLDTRRNEYKVIRIINFPRRKRERIAWDPAVEVYNSSTDSWRILNVDVGLLTKVQFWTAYSTSTYLNGFYYWLLATDDEVQFVLTFDFSDFSDEVFEEIHLPQDIITPESTSTLVKFNETITVMGKGVNDCIGIWMLNMNDGDDMKKKTWTKLYRIPFQCGKVVGFLRSGEVLVLSLVNYDDGSARLELYDPSTQQLKNLQVYDRAIVNYQMIDYVESLVSFKGAYNISFTNTLE